MNQNWLERPVFICGYPKSGTTLLTSLLDSHPQLVNIPEETNVYKKVLPEFRKLPENISSAEKAENLFRLVTSYQLGRFNSKATTDSIAGNYDYSNVDFGIFKESYLTFVHSNNYTDKSIIQGIAYAFYNSSRTYQGKTGFTQWVEKSTRNEKFSDQIMKDFSGARFIHIVRDPRDNWVSYKKKHSGLRVFNYCKDWLYSYHLLKKNIAALSENRYLVVKYEDLVSQPNDQMERIAKFLDIENNETLFQPTKNGVAWHGNSMWGNRNTEINNAALNRFTAWKPQSDIHKIESILHKPMADLGYSINNKSRFHQLSFTVFHCLKSIKGFFKF